MRLRDVILRNFWLKFFSIALATVIWLGIHYGIHNELSISRLNINEITLPVTTITAPGDTRTFKVTPGEVTVYAVGDKAALREGIKVFVDLTDFRGAESAAEDLHTEAPREINVITVSPQTVAVTRTSP